VRAQFGPLTRIRRVPWNTEDPAFGASTPTKRELSEAYQKTAYPALRSHQLTCRRSARILDQAAKFSTIDDSPPTSPSS
jgi:hypothetical protein